MARELFSPSISPQLHFTVARQNPNTGILGPINSLRTGLLKLSEIVAPILGLRLQGLLDAHGIPRLTSRGVCLCGRRST